MSSSQPGERQRQVDVLPSLLVLLVVAHLLAQRRTSCRGGGAPFGGASAPGETRVADWRLLLTHVRRSTERRRRNRFRRAPAWTLAVRLINISASLLPVDKIDVSSRYGQ